MMRPKSEIVRRIKANPRWLAVGSLLILLVSAGVWWSLRPAVHSQSTGGTGQLPLKADFGMTQPLPERIELDSGKVALGEKLFHDVRLSGDDSIGCFSCHGLQTAGVDNRARSVGVNGAIGDINAPTVFNSGFNFVQFWDGRAATLEDQVDGPVNNPKEMASNWPQVIAKLSKDPLYREQFSGLYPDGISAANIRDAIATFERSLVTPNSRFDKYLRGNKAALSEEERRGLGLFESYGCSSCHQGINLGGNMFEKMGLMRDYFADRGNQTDADIGRFKQTHDQINLHEFKVPSLRNVARTAPYFHDGSAQTLRQAVVVMAKYQLGRPIPEEDVDAIVAFLESLTGEYKGEPL